MQKAKVLHKWLFYESTFIFELLVAYVIDFGNTCINKFENLILDYIANFIEPFRNDICIIYA